MKQLPRVTDAEWEIMKVLWANPDCPSSAIVTQLADTVGWSPNTTRTLLNRLVEKEAVGSRQEGESRRGYLFYPLVSEQEYVKSETKSFMKKLYGGALKPMLANFLQDKKLSAQEIEELKQLFEENKSDGPEEKRDL